MNHCEEDNTLSCDTETQRWCTGLARSGLLRMGHGVSHWIGLGLAEPCRLGELRASYYTCRCILCRGGTAMGFCEGQLWAMGPHSVGICLLY